MAIQTAYPTGLDAAPTDVVANDAIASTDWNKYMDGAVKLEEYLGALGSAVTSSHRYRLDALEALPVSSASHSQLFTANGTFTGTVGVTLVWVTLVGGGGGGSGGGGGHTATYKGGGGAGGGGGECIYRFPVVLTAGEAVPVTAGAGGTSGTAGSYPRGDGGPGGGGGFSRFTAASISLIASSGYGAVLVNNGAETTADGNGSKGAAGGGTGGAPETAARGVGTEGDQYIYGSGGSSGGGGDNGTGTTGAGSPGGENQRYPGGVGGTAASKSGGGGGASMYGPGGAGGNLSTAGSTPSTYGGGGGGGCGGAVGEGGYAGAAGAIGFVLVEWVA